MPPTHHRLQGSDEELFALFGLIASGHHLDALRRIRAEPDLASRALRTGASRQDPETSFLAAIRHHVYAGDTALHVAAASYQRGVAELLVAQGALVRARNRRGAEPLHYAADGGPATHAPKSDIQREVIAYLISAGADPDALDKSGVAPLHRAVRNRSSGAVSALIAHEADPRVRNKHGSTPLHLAVQTTGKSGSGLEGAKEEQRLIIAALLEHGARPTDVDASGKTVTAAASSEWVRHQLASSPPAR